MGAGATFVADAELSETVEPGECALNGEIYLGQDPNAQQVGDMRIAFSQVKPMVVSLYAAQIGSTFEPYLTEVGKPVERIEAGEHSAAAMFHEAALENNAVTWGNSAPPAQIPKKSTRKQKI